MTPLTERVTEIVARDLEVVYQRGAEPAVSGIDFTLGPGDALLLTGGHGSGKTSVLRAVLGLARATGDIEVLGSYPGDPQNAARIGYAPQGRLFSDGLTPRHLVTTVAVLRTGRRDAGAVHDALDQAGIPSDRHDARVLGVEELRRLSLACALVGSPDVLVLDDPWEFEETVTAIDRTRERGGIVIGASHEPGGLPEFFGSQIALVGLEDDDGETGEADTDDQDSGATEEGGE